MPQCQLFCAAHRCGKTQRLVDVARAALESGVSSGQILALAVHRPAAAVLRQMLSKGTGRDIPTTTVRQRALAILQAYPAAARLPTDWAESALLSGIDRRRLIRQGWASVGSGKHSLFAQRGRQPGALDWIALLFDRFSDWCGTTDPDLLPAIQPTDAALAELWRAYQAYLRLCQQYGAVAFSEVFNRASDALRVPHVRKANTRQIVLLDDLDLFQPAELLFVSTLIQAKTDVYATCSAMPRPDSALALERLLVRWMTEGGEQRTENREQRTTNNEQRTTNNEQRTENREQRTTNNEQRTTNNEQRTTNNEQRTEDQERQALEQFRLLSNEAIAPPRHTLTVGEYATADTEAHAIARRIVEQAASTIRLSEIAVVAFDPELVPLLQRVLPEYGVPVQGQAARDGYTLAVAPLAVAGLKLLAGQTLTLMETTALLRHSALGLSSADAHVMIEAVEQKRFQPFNPDDSRWPVVLSAAGRDRLTAVRDTTTTIRSTEHPPSIRLQSWLAALDFEARAWAQTAAALEPWAVAIDRRHWMQVLDFLRQSEALNAALGTPLTLDEAVEVFTSAQALITSEGQPQQQAVQIWQPAVLGGCTARSVFVAGLHEGALPQAMQPLPCGDDAALAAAFGVLPGFVEPQIQDRAAAWERAHQDLRRAMGRAGDILHLSYSRADRQGRTRLPSPVLAAVIGAQIDRHGQLHSDANGGVAIETTMPTDGATASAPALWPRRFAENSLLEALPPLPQIPLPAQSPFQVSPSAIEDYFTCPRRCFYARMLGLYDVISSPRQALGHVVHNALNDLLHEAREASIDEARIRPLVARHWLPDEHRWGSQLKQTVFRQLAEKAVAQLARYETERTDRVAFIGGELRFRWPLSDTDVIISGRIDRIDRSAEGLHIIDYKLGQQSPSINELLNEFVPPRAADDTAAWRPGDIQLPVYALAIDYGEVEGLERLPGERVASVGLVYPLALYGDNGKLSVRGRREINVIDHADDGCAGCTAAPERSPKTGTLCRSQLAAVEARVRDTVIRMRAAEWQPDPREGSQTCAGCAFRPICSDPQ